MHLLYIDALPCDIQEKIYFMHLQKSILTINRILTRAYHNKVLRKANLQHMVMKLQLSVYEGSAFHDPTDVDVYNALFIAKSVLTRREVSVYGDGAVWWYENFLQPIKNGLYFFQYAGSPHFDIYNKTDDLYNNLIVKYNQA
jgi:hypothetical protein